MVMYAVTKCRCICGCGYKSISSITPPLHTDIYGLSLSHALNILSMCQQNEANIKLYIYTSTFQRIHFPFKLGEHIASCVIPSHHHSSLPRVAPIIIIHWGHATAHLCGVLPHNLQSSRSLKGTLKWSLRNLFRMVVILK